VLIVIDESLPLQTIVKYPKSFVKPKVLVYIRLSNIPFITILFTFKSPFINVSPVTFKPSKFIYIFLLLTIKLSTVKLFIVPFGE
jgi:hypothetical protein